MSPDVPPPPPPPAYGFHPGAAPQGGPPKTSGAAIASLVLGALSVIACCFTGVPGLICGFVGLSNISKSQGQLKGKGLAMLGIALSLVLPVVEVGGFLFLARSNPELMQGINSTKTMFKASTQGTELSAALLKYAGENDGTLPNDLNELVAAGHLDAEKLTNPVDGSTDFWTLLQPGKKLAELGGKEPIAKAGPFVMGETSTEVVVLADGSVEPRQSTLGGNSGELEAPAEEPAADPADAAVQPATE